MQSCGSGRWQATVGEWSAGDDQTYLLELVVPPVASGTHSVARIELRYQLVSAQQPQAASVTLSLPASISPPQAVAQPVRRALERVVAYQQQSRAWQAVAEGRIDDATRRLQTAGTHLFNAGDVELAQTVHAEATRLLQGGATSADGRKRIKYGTRGLLAGA